MSTKQNKGGDDFLDNIFQATQLINEASNVVVITGAGASTESGIPDFRSDNGPTNPTALLPQLPKFIDNPPTAQWTSIIRG